MEMRATRSGRAPTTARAPASPSSRISSENTLAAKSTGVPCVPRYTGATMALPVRSRSRSRAGMMSAGSRGWSPRTTSAASVSRRQRRGAGRDRRPLPVLRPRIHHEAHRQPDQRRPHRRVVMPRDHDQITHVRHNTLDRPPHHRLALQLEQQLLPPHPPRQPRRQNDPSNQTPPARQPMLATARRKAYGRNAKAPAVPGRAPERMLH